MQRPRRSKSTERLATLVVFLAVGAFAAGCTTSRTSPATTRGTHKTASSSTAGAPGPVDVLYAGSLVDLMQNQVDPAFAHATGGTVNGVAGGSDALASQIKGETRQADVFISAARSVNPALEGSANGSWVSWYSSFATSSLVLAYNPQSPFASALKSRPWYDVVDQPGFRLGRTDPATDPKGVLAVNVLRQVSAEHHLPALASIANGSANVFPEATLVGRLQAGQLDAGFFYTVETKAAHLTTVPLVGVHAAATFTVTVLNRAPHRAAAIAFVRFLLGRTGAALLRRDGLTPIMSPVTSGDRGAIPSGLRTVLFAT